MRQGKKKSLLGRRDLSTGRVSVSSPLGRILLHRKADSINIVSAIRSAVKNGSSGTIVLNQPIAEKELNTSK